MATDWDALHRALWRAVKAHAARVGETAAEYAAAIVAAVRAGGGALTPEAQQHITDYLDAADGLIREGIERAVAPIADVAVAAEAMRSPFIAQATAEAYARRWPDGLTLSHRVWNWQEATRRGVSEALSAAVQTGRAADAVMMDLQRAIEAAQGQRFALVSVLPEDWADRLAASARRSITTPGAMNTWAAVVKEAKEHVAGLRVGGTRRQAEHTLAAILKAVADGRQDLVDRHLGWWLYDRQQYNLRRIVRTEMATAHHRAVIAATQDDPDVTGYRWRLSASHEVPDICDYYADVDFGMGAGVWPADQVPRSKAHPHCMCSLTPTTRKMRKDGQRGATDYPAFLDRLPASQLKEMVPAWARAAHADGTPWAQMMRADGLGLRAAGSGAVPAPATAAVILSSAAYRVATEGGRHSGWLANVRATMTPRQIRKGIASLDKQVALHRGWIGDPRSKPGMETVDAEEIRRNVERKWPEDIARQTEQRDILISLLEELTGGKGTGGT